MAPNVLVYSYIHNVITVILLNSFKLSDQNKKKKDGAGFFRVTDCINKERKELMTSPNKIANAIDSH